MGRLCFQFDQLRCNEHYLWFCKHVWLFLLLVLQKGRKEFLNWIVYLHEDADFCNRFCQAVKNTNLMLFDSEFSRILALPVSFKPGQFPVATCVGSKVANF